MTNETQPAGPHQPIDPQPLPYQYGVDGVRYHSDSSSITGGTIKRRIPNFDPAFQLFLEGEGGDADRLITDSESVDLSGTPKRFYTAPPATFGS